MPWFGGSSTSAEEVVVGLNDLLIEVDAPSAEAKAVAFFKSKGASSVDELLMLCDPGVPLAQRLDVEEVVKAFSLAEVPSSKLRKALENRRWGRLKKHEQVIQGVGGIWAAAKDMDAAAAAQALERTWQAAFEPAHAPAAVPAADAPAAIEPNHGRSGDLSNANVSPPLATPAARVAPPARARHTDAKGGYEYEVELEKLPPHNHTRGGFGWQRRLFRLRLLPADEVDSRPGTPRQPSPSWLGSQQSAPKLQRTATPAGAAALSERSASGLAATRHVPVLEYHVRTGASIVLKGTIYLNDVATINAVLVRPHHLSGRRTSMEPQIEIRMKDKLTHSVDGDQEGRLYHLRAPAEEEDEAANRPRLGSGGEMQPHRAVAKLHQFICAIGQYASDDLDAGACAVHSNFKVLLELAEDSRHESPAASANACAAGARSRIRHRGCLRKLKAPRGRFKHFDHRYFVLTEPLKGFPLLRYDEPASRVTSLATRTQYYKPGVHASYLLYSKSSDAFSSLHFQHVLPCEWIAEVRLKGPHDSPLDDEDDDEDEDDEQLGSFGEWDDFRGGYVRRAYAKLTVRNLEGGSNFKLFAPKDNSADGATLRPWVSLLKLFKPGPGQPLAETTHAVLRPVGGRSPRFQPHILKLTRSELRLFSNGSLELEVKLERLERLLIERWHVGGEEVLPHWIVRLSYKNAVARSWSFKGSGHVKLLMQSPKDAEIFHSMLGKWAPFLERVVCDHSSALHSPGSAMLLPPAAPLLLAPPSREPLEVWMMGKLEVKTAQAYFFYSHHVTLYSTGQLVLADNTGSRPFLMVNLLQQPLYRPDDASQATEFFVACQEGAIRLRCTCSEERDKWMSKVQCAMTSASAAAARRPSRAGNSRLVNVDATPERQEARDEVRIAE